MLVLSLKREQYHEIECGGKCTVYREVKPYWTTRLWHEGCLPTNGIWSYEAEQKAIGNNWLFPVTCILQLGCTKQQMIAVVTKIETINVENTDLKIDKLVYAIHLVCYVVK